MTKPTESPIALDSTHFHRFVPHRVDCFQESGMNRVQACVGGVAVLSLSACAAVAPSGPQVAAMPGQGKTYEQFQADDGYCQGAANQQTAGSVAAAQQATNNSVASTAVGTVLGAAVGAGLGSLGGNVGAGAAVGAGAGAALGASNGANGAAATTVGLQRQYDTIYLQCMVARGNQPPQAPTIVQAPPVYYAAPPPVYYAPGPVYYGPRYYRGY
jgi:hypothetical protein